ncbi:DUF2235 domain-containing protein [Aurantiacibacter rhizosphaerae]|uniref:DUF2235 domain-containing protein n=1 Tax=Aurantiacibacter rhizosphaerae TaxID=2691582 RepID=A0A844XHT8_9SPHN|nr:DUF2235 domain-containing protein [Aurantiacibacter rhizosphaerae]MWV29115.1 DUF2235 domain-containing protein [Aurantiacibacter rhizosphaerae]
MAKNIVILLDGTSNQISSNRSNVLRFYGILAKSDEQVVYYDPGVGTLGTGSRFSHYRTKMVELLGLATGYGLDDNVKEAYRFLVENYGSRGADEERDRIYIIGFSRGAYTARVLAGFLNAFGLMEKRNLNLLDYAYRAYKRIGEEGQDEATAFAEMRLFERILRPDRAPVRMLGLFDTVASVIEHGRYGLRLKSHAFTSRNPSVESVFHAVAIEERRTMFRPVLWEKDQEYRGNPFNAKGARPQQLKEVWFPGYHADVGGGHAEEESGLCKVPLVWMIEQARTAGLQFTTRSVNSLVLGSDPASKYVPPNRLGETHDSMNLAWSILEMLPRRKAVCSRRPSIFGWSIPWFERRHIPTGASIHRAVEDRKAAGMGWPKNIPEDFTFVE